MSWKEFSNKYLRLNAINVERLVGLTLMAKGLLLLFDIHYFFYPPNLKSLMNNDVIDIFITLTGLLLFILTFIRCRNTKEFTTKIFIIKILLAMAAFIFLTLALSQIMHGILTPEHRMTHTALGDLFIFVIIDLTASDV